jgi:hypothetical protein
MVHATAPYAVRQNEIINNHHANTKNKKTKKKLKFIKT